MLFGQIDCNTHVLDKNLHRTAWRKVPGEDPRRCIFQHRSLHGTLGQAVLHNIVTKSGAFTDQDHLGQKRHGGIYEEVGHDLHRRAGTAWPGVRRVGA